MKAAIYSSTVVGDTGGVPKFNASAFPAHDHDTEIVYLNGNYPEIVALCREQGLTVKPYAEFRKSKGKRNG